MGLGEGVYQSLLNTLLILSLKLIAKSQISMLVFMFGKENILSDVYLHMPLFAHSIHHPTFNWSSTCPTDGDTHFVVAG